MNRRRFLVTTLLVMILVVSAAIIASAILEKRLGTKIDVPLIGALAATLVAVSVLAAFKDILETVPMTRHAAKEPPSGVTDSIKDRSGFQASRADSAQLFYRVAVLEGYLNWMLHNGQFVRSIESEEIQQIRLRAEALVKEKYPEAQIVAVPEGGQQ